jgi:hypothetical protein
MADREIYTSAISTEMCVVRDHRHRCSRTLDLVGTVEGHTAYLLEEGSTR